MNKSNWNDVQIFNDNLLTFVKVNLIFAIFSCSSNKKNIGRKKWDSTFEFIQSKSLNCNLLLLFELQSLIRHPSVPSSTFMTYVHDYQIIVNFCYEEKMLIHFFILNYFFYFMCFLISAYCLALCCVFISR